MQNLTHLARVTALSGLVFIGASAQTPPWVHGRPDIGSGDMILDGCLRPGVESQCRMLDYTSRPTGGNGQALPPVQTTYNVGSIDPVPRFDRRIVLVARASTGRASSCGANLIAVRNWYYSSDPTPCPPRDWSPFDDPGQ